MNQFTSLGEEIANSVTHGVGVILAIIGTTILLALGLRDNQFEKVVGYTIFGISASLAYGFSTLYHSLYFTSGRKVLQRLDHATIFLLIAGSYTPFLLILLKNGLGLMVLLFVWLISLLGIVYKLAFGDKKQTLMIILYVFLGWLGIFLIRPLQLLLPPKVLALLIIGGFFYTLGIILFLWKKLKFNHALWHLFVLGGTISHFLALVFLSVNL